MNDILHPFTRNIYAVVAGKNQVRSASHPEISKTFTESDKRPMQLCILEPPPQPHRGSGVYPARIFRKLWWLYTVSAGKTGNTSFERVYIRLT